MSIKVMHLFFIKDGTNKQVLFETKAYALKQLRHIKTKQILTVIAYKPDNSTEWQYGISFKHPKEQNNKTIGIQQAISRATTAPFYKTSDENSVKSMIDFIAQNFKKIKSYYNNLQGLNKVVMSNEPVRHSS
jgi:hypothetical protein